MLLAGVLKNVGGEHDGDKMSRKTKARDVASFIIGFYAENPDNNDLTHMKLQKLLYYCQGFYLAINGDHLFSDEIEAWQHGPVVRSVYEEIIASVGGGRQILTSYPGQVSPLTPEEEEIVLEVLHVYGQFSASRLRDLSHAEDPWKDNFNDTQKERIPLSDLKKYFLTKVTS